MADDLQEIDGIGPSREADLKERGYETYADLADANHETLAEEVKNMNQDTALEIVVQSQNMADLKASEVEEEPDVEESVEEETVEGVEEAVQTEQLVAEVDESESVDEAAATVEEDEIGPYTFELSFETAYEYDSFYHTLLEHRAAIKRTNRSGIETYESLLESMRNSSYDTSVEVEMTEDQLNNLHNAVLEQRIDYQGDNLIDYMEALRAVENRLNDIRRDRLF